MKAAMLILGLIGSLIAMAGSLATVLGGLGGSAGAILMGDMKTADNASFVTIAGLLSVIVAIEALVFSVIGGLAKKKVYVFLLSIGVIVTGLTSIYLYNLLSGIIISIGGVLGAIGAKDGEDDANNTGKAVFALFVTVILAITVASSVIVKHGAILARKKQEDRTVMRYAIPSTEHASSLLYNKAYYHDGMHTTDNEVTTLWLSKEFKFENELYHAYFFQRQESDERQRCHACAAILDIVTYKKSTDGWKEVSVQKQFDTIGSWGRAPNAEEIIYKHLSPTVYSLFVVDGYTAQGSSFNWADIISFTNNRWSNRGSIKLGGSHYGSGSVNYSYDGTINIKEGSDVQYPDISVMMTGTMPANDYKTTRPAISLNYQFNGEKYQLLCNNEDMGLIDDGCSVIPKLDTN